MIQPFKANEKGEPKYDDEEVELNKFQNITLYNQDKNEGNGTLFVTTRYFNF